MTNRDIATAILQGVKDNLGGDITNENDGPSVAVEFKLKTGMVNVRNAPYMFIKYYDRKDWNSDPNLLSFFVKFNLPGALFPITGKWVEKYVRQSAKSIEAVMGTLFDLTDTGFNVYINDDVIELEGEAKGSWDYASKSFLVDRTIKDIVKSIKEINGNLQYEIGDGYDKYEEFNQGDSQYSYSVLTGD